MSPGYDPENVHDDACGIDWVFHFSGIVLNLKRPRTVKDLSRDRGEGALQYLPAEKGD